MFLKNNDLLKEKDFIKRCKPHSKQIKDYIESFIAPDLIAFYIASGFYSSSIYEQKLDTLITTGLEFLNTSINNNEILIENIKKTLKIKYNLSIIEVNPLIVETYYK